MSLNKPNIDANIWSSEKLLKTTFSENNIEGKLCGVVTLKSTDHKGLFEYIKEGIGME